MHLNIILTVATFFLMLFPSVAQQHFEKEQYINGTDTLPYNILKPYGYLRSFQKGQEKFVPKNGFPLIIFLHGAGERSSDNKKQTVHIKKLFSETNNYMKFKAFVIAPQCPEGKKWVEVDWSSKSHTLPKEPSWALANTMELVNELIKKYPVDTTRIYLTGLSMGGYGVWDLLSRYPEKFAAAIPICGGGDEKVADRFKDIPIWAFHGSNDKVVPVSRTQNMINAIKSAGGNPKYTEYKGVGHGSWFKAYKEKDLLKWLFEQQLK